MCSNFKFDKSLVKLFSSEKYDECFEGCKKKLIKDPLDLQALLYMANISLDRRKLDDCIHYCDTIIQGVDERIYYVWSCRGQALCLQKKYKESEESYMQAIQYNRTSTEIWSYMALTIFMQDRKDSAMSLLDIVEEKLECHNKFTMVRGFIERADGNIDDALIHFIEGGMAVDPTADDYNESKEVYAREVRKTVEKE